MPIASVETQPPPLSTHDNIRNEKKDFSSTEKTGSRKSFKESLKSVQEKAQEDKEPESPLSPPFPILEHRNFISEESARVTAAAIEGGSAYDRLHPEIASVFERVVSEMILIDACNEKHAVLTLNSPAFSNSIFFGTKVLISEFSTAPKVFNVQFIGSQAAAQVFQTHAPEFYRTFQSQSFDFSIHQFDWSFEEDVLEKLLPGSPIESIEGDAP